MRDLNNFGALLGRFLIAIAFLFSGTRKLLHTGTVTRVMVAHHVPARYASPLLLASAAIELVCGLAVLTGFFARPAALVLVLWLIPVTCLFHVATGQLFEVMKNLAIMGGLLVLAANGPGGWRLGA